MSWVHLPSGREDHVCQEGFLAQRLDVGEEDVVVVIPLEAEVLPRHGHYHSADKLGLTALVCFPVFSAGARLRCGVVRLLLCCGGAVCCAVSGRDSTLLSVLAVVLWWGRAARHRSAVVSGNYNNNNN